MSVGQCDRETNFGFTGCWSRTVARRPRMTLRLTPASNARASPVARAATVHWNQQADVGTHRHWRPLKPCLNFVSQRTNGSPQRWRNMASETYIVRLVRANEHATLKHLLARKAAIHYAQQHMDGADLLRCTGSARRKGGEGRAGESSAQLAYSSTCGAQVGAGFGCGGPTRLLPSERTASRSKNRPLHHRRPRTAVRRCDLISD